LTLENSFNDPNNVFNFTYTDNCFYSEINPRTFVEKNFSGIGTVESKEINFPVNIYSPSNDTFLWVYDGVSALDSKRINIKYLLIKDNSYLDGVCLTSIKYKKTDNSLYSHELRTPSDYVYTAYNNITLEIPINNFSQEGYPVSYSNLETIENVVTSNVNLIIDTEFNNNFNSYNLNSSAFQLQSISTLSNSYKLIYSFDEGSNTGNSGIVEIVVTKCPALSNSQELVGTLIITTQSCCEDNPLIRDFSSESSDSSYSSISSISSSSSSSFVEQDITLTIDRTQTYLGGHAWLTAETQRAYPYDLYVFLDTEHDFVPPSEISYPSYIIIYEGELQGRGLIGTLEDNRTPVSIFSSQTIEIGDTANITVSIFPYVAPVGGMEIELIISSDLQSPAGYFGQNIVTIPEGESYFEFEIVTYKDTDKPAVSISPMVPGTIEIGDSSMFTVSIAPDIAPYGGFIVDLNVTSDITPPYSYNIPSSVTIPEGESSIIVNIDTN